jgi:hypothetical protein
MQPRVRVERRPPGQPGWQLGLTWSWDDPGGSRRPAVSHLHRRAHAAAAATRPEAERSAPPLHTAPGREAPGSFIELDQILTQTLKVLPASSSSFLNPLLIGATRLGQTCFPRFVPNGL